MQRLPTLLEVPSGKSVRSYFRSGVLALLLVISCVTVVLATPAGDAYKHGKDLLEKKDYTGAIRALDRAISLNPKFALAYVSRGKAYDKLGQHQRGIDDYNKAISLDPKSAE